MNNLNAKVSIIMPSYKRNAELVGRAIQSLFAQTYRNIEIVLVDDNAKIEHKEFREELQRLVATLSDERLVYIENQENLGGAGARNEGINKATGEYITFLDDDDEYLPEKVEKQLLFMQENELDVCFTSLCIYNENGKLTDVRTHNIISFDIEYLRKYHLTKQITGTPTFMMKKKVLEDVGGFEIVSMGQEYYLMQKILLNGTYKLGYDANCYVKAYRTAAEAISTGKNKITGEKALFAYKKTFFKILNRKERRYVRCRHYAVMAVAYKRNRIYIKTIACLIWATLCSPVTAVKEAIELKKRIRKVAHE